MCVKSQAGVVVCVEQLWIQLQANPSLKPQNGCEKLTGDAFVGFPGMWGNTMLHFFRNIQELYIYIYMGWYSRERKSTFRVPESKFRRWKRFIEVKTGGLINGKMSKVYDFSWGLEKL